MQTSVVCWVGWWWPIRPALLSPLACPCPAANHSIVLAQCTLTVPQGTVALRPSVCSTAAERAARSPSRRRCVLRFCCTRVSRVRARLRPSTLALVAAMLQLKTEHMLVVGLCRGRLGHTRRLGLQLRLMPYAIYSCCHCCAATPSSPLQRGVGLLGVVCCMLLLLCITR